MTRRYRSAYLRVFVGFAIAYFAGIGLAAELTFANKTSRVLHLKTYAGELCRPGTPILSAFELFPGSSQSVATSDAKVCFLVSLGVGSASSPIYCGAISSTGSFTFDDSTPLCGERRGTRTQNTRSVEPEAKGKQHIDHFPGDRVFTLEENKGRLGEIYLNDRRQIETSIASWTDPLTPPRTEFNCSREAWGDLPNGGQWRFCVAWQINCQWMNNDLIVSTSTSLVPTLPEAQTIVEACFKESLVESAAAGLAMTIATGGGGIPAAWEAFKLLFSTCMTEKLANDYMNVSLRVRSQWSPWGVCVRP